VTVCRENEAQVQRGTLLVPPSNDASPWEMRFVPPAFKVAALAQL
jgi:hypothetical protein